MITTRIREWFLFDVAIWHIVDMSKTKTANLRKTRSWAATPDQLETLGRGAQRLAKMFVSKQKSAGVATCLNRFKQLLKIESESRLAQGDTLVELIDQHGCRAIDIERATGLDHSKISQRYHTAKAFPPSERHQKLSYNYYFMAMVMSRKFDELSMSPEASLQEILSSGYTQHDQVTQHFVRLNRQRRLRMSGANVDELKQSPFAQSLHHKRFQDIFALVPDGAAKIIQCDPPYVYADGTYRSSSTRSQECDNNTRQGAVSTVVDLLRHWQPKLAPGGVLLLWQASGRIAKEIDRAIDKYGWSVSDLVTWDKGTVKPGSFTTPYCRQTEALWVLSRQGDELINHDGSSRGDILRFAPLSGPASIAHQEHHFEKPASLCEFLIRKHSDPGELVIDQCGCTASMSMAAIRTGRRWIYVESNRKNFRLGEANIAQCLAAQQTAA